MLFKEDIVWRVNNSSVQRFCGTNIFRVALSCCLVKETAVNFIIARERSACHGDNFLIRFVCRLILHAAKLVRNALKNVCAGVAASKVYATAAI